MPNNADEIMPGAAMKMILKLAQTVGERVPIAVALDADKNAAVLVAKKGKAKSLKSAFTAAVKKKKLEAKFKTDSQSLFFGYGTTETGAEGILKLSLNKMPPGGDMFAHKVFARVKGAGFGKVVLATDPSLEEEKDEEEQAPQPETMLQPERTTPQEPTPEQKQAEAMQRRLHDATLLKKALSNLIPQIGKAAGDNSKLAETLQSLAHVAAEALKQDSLMDAATAIAKLKSALDVAANSGGTGKVDLARPRLIWLATRKKAREETAKLRGKLVEHYEPQGIAPAIVASYDRVVETLFSELDDSLADTLDAAASARAPEERSKLVLQAKETIGRYEKTLGTAPLTNLENNPFAKLALGEMLATSLKALSTAIR